MKRKRRANEIICICNAYDYPHRLGGGNCNGSEWCISFRSIDSYDCQQCNHNTNDECDITTGQEELNTTDCECIVEELRTRYIEDEYGYLPLDVEDYYEKLWRNYNER